MFEDSVQTVNVTRDDLLISTHRKHHFIGDIVDVVGAYGENPTAMSTPGQAKVVRPAILPGQCYGVALQSTSALATRIDALLIEAEGHDICGKNLCGIVKTKERLRHVPIIFLTSSALPSDCATGHHLGAVV